MALFSELSDLTNLILHPFGDDFSPVLRYIFAGTNSNGIESKLVTKLTKLVNKLVELTINNLLFYMESGCYMISFSYPCLQA